MNISVIIPAYNAEETIHETIQSLQQQTYPGWEAVIIDDGSRDETISIAQSFAQQDARIRLTSQPNKGASAARNTGISQARYDWLLFLDADDWITSNYLARMTDALAADPELDAVYCGVMYVLPGGALVNHTDWIKSENLFAAFAWSCAFSIHACIIRRTLVEEVGGFDTSLRTCEDWDLWQRATRTGAQFGTVHQIMAMYRMRPRSASEDGFQLLQDGLKVITRGHGSDPRVPNPAPAYRNGISAATLSTNIFSFLSCTAGLALAQGQNPLPMLKHIQNVQDPGLNPLYVANSIFKAVLLPTCQTPDGWQHLWPQLEFPIIQFLEALEKQSQAEKLAYRACVHLERLIVKNGSSDQPITVGHSYSTIIEITQPITDISTPIQVERLIANVKMEGTQLGYFELPVCAGFVPGYVLTDTIAAIFAWAILGLFFERTIYPELQVVTDETGFSAWREKILLAAKVPINRISSLHDDIGWHIFLQEFWGKPEWTYAQFYKKKTKKDAADSHYCVENWLIIEITATIPDVEVYHEQLHIIVMVANKFVGTVAVLAHQNLIRAQEIRVAVTEACGLELCRTAVREGLVGKPFGQKCSLRARLQAAAVAARQYQTNNEPIDLFPDQMLIPLLNKQGRVMALGRHPYGAIGTAISRRASLPPQAVVTLTKAAMTNGQLVRYLPQTNKQLPQTIVYVPEWQEQPSARTSTAPSNSESSDWRTHFEALFTRQRDPWQYTSPYEQIKYAQTLSLLPEGNSRYALEIGCAEGHFTVQLSSRVAHLLAVDFSKKALNRAAKRCDGLTNVAFKVLDLRADSLPNPFDLIVCSEILYYMENEATLRQAAVKMVNALTDGGFLLTAHAHLNADDPERTGFDWDLPFGAKKIGKILASTSGLQLSREIRTPLYRIQLFRRNERRRFRFRRKPDDTRLNYQPTLLLQHVEKYAIWRDKDKIKKPPYATLQLPILMYHRVAPTGADALTRYRITPEVFAAQLHYLREAGYYSIHFDEWQEAARKKTPLPGRAVLITFDDGYLDFFNYAFPLLKRYNFTATVFLVADKVGQTNDWDAVYEEALPLMNWEQIQQIQKQGMQFGSHTATHPHLTGLSPLEIVEETARSQAILTQKLKTQVNSFAYPYGDMDEVVQHLVGACGYPYGVTTQQRLCSFKDTMTALPRIEVMGNDTLSDFVIKLEG